MYPEKETIHSIEIQKSEFICYLKHVESEEEFKEYLSAIRKKHYDATHVCSAFICHDLYRSNDDGEPSGTAGKPILNVLIKRQLDETCALVVRYFGGTKLGAGGLIRAYGNAVSECLKQAVLVENRVYPKYSLKTGYETGNRISEYLKKHTVLLNTIYDTEVTFIFALDDIGKLEKIKEYTKGTLPQLIGEENIRKVVE